MRQHATFRALRRLYILTRRVRRGTDAHRAALWAEFLRWFDRLELSENSILFGFAVLIGSLTALAVVAFYGLIDLAFEVLYRWPSVYLPHISFLAYRPVVTAIGLFLAWWTIRTYAARHPMNVPDVQVAVARHGGLRSRQHRRSNRRTQ